MRLTEGLRVVVSHPARQGSVYYRPRAAEQSGIDVRFLTGLYYRPEHFPYLAVRWLPNHQKGRAINLLEKRRIDGLSPDNVISLLGPTLELTLRPFGLIRQWETAHDWLSSRWISRHQEPNRITVLHGFQGSCLRTLRASKRKHMVRLLEITLPQGPSQLYRWEMGNAVDPMSLFKAELAEADFVLAQSEFSVQTLVDLGVTTDRIFRLHCGVDTQRFQPRKGDRHPGPLRVLFVGRISRRKGVHHLLQAWKELHFQGAELLLVGDAGSPEAKTLLSQKPANCKSLGFVSAKEHIEAFQQADILVHPSLAEGSCHAVYEALACGLPCVVSSNAGSAVRSGIEGFTVAPGDIEGLKAAIRRLYLEPDLRNQMGIAARRRAETLSWERFNEHLAAIYRALAEFARHGNRQVLEPLLQSGF